MDLKVEFNFLKHEVAQQVKQIGEHIGELYRLIETQFKVLEALDARLEQLEPKERINDKGVEL